jgi:hypothetical protein
LIQRAPPASNPVINSAPTTEEESTIARLIRTLLWLFIAASSINQSQKLSTGKSRQPREIGSVWKGL